MRFTNVLAVAASLLLGTASALPAPQPTAGGGPPGVPVPESTGTVAPEPSATLINLPEVTMPSLQQLLDAFEPVMPADSSLFYTGGTKLAAVQVQRDRKKADPAHPLLTIKEVWQQNASGFNSNYWLDITDMDLIEAEKEYGRLSSLAFAQATTGAATVVVPEPFDENKAKDSVWMNVEKPALAENMRAGTVTSLTTKRFKKVGTAWKFDKEDTVTTL